MIFIRKKNLVLIADFLILHKISSLVIVVETIFRLKILTSIGLLIKVLLFILHFWFFFCNFKVNYNFSSRGPKLIIILFQQALIKNSSRLIFETLRSCKLQTFCLFSEIQNGEYNVAVLIYIYLLINLEPLLWLERYRNASHPYSKSRGCALPG